MNGLKEIFAGSDPAMVALAAFGLLVIIAVLVLRSTGSSGGEKDNGMGPTVTWAKVRTRLGFKEAVKAARRRIPADVCGDPTQLVLLAGKWKGKSLYTQHEDSLIVIGPTRSGKSRLVGIPRVRHAIGPAVVTSTRNDLAHANHLTTTGRGRVWAYDPTGTLHADAALSMTPLMWDPVLGCEDPEGAIRRGAAWAAAQPMGNVKNGDWFNKRAAELLTRLLHAAALDGRNILDVARWAQNLSDSQPATILEEHGNSDWARYLRGLGTSRAGETVDAVKMSVGGVLAPLASPATARTLTPAREDHFDVYEFLSGRNTAFLIAPERGHSTVAPVFTMLIDEILHVASTISQTQPGGFLWPPLSVTLDEAANIAPLPNLDGYLSDSGGRGISICAMFQSRDQIKKRWGDDAAGAIWKAGTQHLVLPYLKDVDLAQEMEMWAGKRRVTRHSHSTGRGGGSTSVSTELVPALPAANVPQISDGTGWLLYRNLPILHVTLPQPAPEEARR